MKKIIAVTAMVMVASAGLWAQEPTVGLTVDATYASKYIFRGVVLGEHALHPSFELSYSDFYAGIWGNVALAKKDDYPDNEEWDFYFGKSFALTDIASLDVGYTYYYYPEFSSNNGTQEVYLGMNWDVSGFSPAIYAYYDFDLEAFTVQGSVGTSIPLESMGTSLDLSASVGHVDADGFSYTYWSVGAAVPFKLSEKSTITAGVTFGTHDISGLDDNNIAGTLSYTFAF
jgi:uncharacterized protein (TIGR02001 family)